VALAAFSLAALACVHRVVPLLAWRCQRVKERAGIGWRGAWRAGSVAWQTDGAGGIGGAASAASAA